MTKRRATVASRQIAPSTRKGVDVLGTIEDENVHHCDDEDLTGHGQAMEVRSNETGSGQIYQEVVSRCCCQLRNRRQAANWRENYATNAFIVVVFKHGVPDGGKRFWLLRLLSAKAPTGTTTRLYSDRAVTPHSKNVSAPGGIVGGLGEDRLHDDIHGQRGWKQSGRCQ